MPFWLVALILGGAAVIFIVAAVLTVGERADERKRGEKQWTREDEGGDYTGWG